ncbi:hypothetical protein SAMN05421812_112200 [Asanoa hainanensis]|uniref:Metallo-peptidase family M12B Reprolysin-like n=1 Tax=Asanoa hainanensis TaxID=560556 RepID=A0A239P131_9ACTN|nr:hypothetical protein [Asanoa hainanensis]SNT60806.1 hypothetical protein SAMN05421812_112200 [Asanoa hainanensis]
MNPAESRNSRALVYRRVRAAFVAVAVAATCLVAWAAPAQALPLSVTVTIVRVAECCPGGPIDVTSDADFYGRTTIAGNSTDFGEIEDQSIITPNWQATETVDHSNATTDVKIEIFDEDDGLNFADNQIDLTSNDADRAVNFSIDLHPEDSRCYFTGDVSGPCGAEVTTQGNADDGDVADMTLMVEVNEPPQAPGRHVRCLHSPLWPQPGETVTITAEAFGDQPDGAALPELISDQLDIFFSTDGGATRQKIGGSGRQTTFSASRTVGAGGSTFSYSCLAIDRLESVDSGWHTVQVGDPPQGRAVPVLLSGNRENALDVVLFPATINVRSQPNNPSNTSLLTFPVYSGPKDANFLNHAGAAVAELMREQRVLDNQGGINVWIARDPAATGGFRDLRGGDGIDDTCQHQPPANLGVDYGFANVRAILHPTTPPPGNTNTLRECAFGGVLSAEAGENGVFIHEVGHAGFGLADEYCCDGGYFQTADVPNVYLSNNACVNDVGSLGGVAADCRGMDSVFDTDTNADFWVSDPASNDLMNDNRFARRADRRRMDFVFGQCDQARC